MLVAEKTSFRPSSKWILAGDAIFTVSIPLEFQSKLGCKDHYTFRVEHVEKTDRWPASWFVKLLTGPDNESNYSYLGKLDDFTGEMRTTAKSCLKSDAALVLLLNRIFRRIWGNDHAAFEEHGFAINHEGTCARCGRLLTTPESCAIGFGPECIKKI